MEIKNPIVLTGPSGVGKGTLVGLILDRHPELHLSISTTTREPRSGEIDGENYYFISRPEFQAAIEAGEFLEWAEFAGNYYGTPRTKVEEQIRQGKKVLLEIEVIGARLIKQSFPRALLIFILPPSIEELEHRLRSRDRDSLEAIERRLQRAKEEIAVADEFDRQIINDNLDKALLEIEQAIFA